MNYEKKGWKSSSKITFVNLFSQVMITWVVWISIISFYNIFIGRKTYIWLRAGRK